jgi:hypothetical protein
MQVNYINRYGDNIIFERLDNNIIKVSGYNPAWVRFGWNNLYDEAYDTYCKNNSEPMSLEDFKDQIHKHEEGKANLLNKYGSLITSDYNTYNMFDPSGGPYISLGSNLKYYFNQKEDIIVNKITPQIDHILINYD